MIDMEQFNKPGSDIFIYILCTRAGGLGVNLQVTGVGVGDRGCGVAAEAEAVVPLCQPGNEIRVSRRIPATHIH